MLEKIKKVVALMIIFSASFTLFFVLFGGKERLKIFLQAKNGTLPVIETPIASTETATTPTTPETPAVPEVSSTTPETPAVPVATTENTATTPETTTTPTTPETPAVPEVTPTTSETPAVPVSTTENTTTTLETTTTPAITPTNPETPANNTPETPATITTEPETITINGKLPYTDVLTNNTAYNDIFFLYDTGIINETTSTLFYPKANISRYDADRAILAVSNCYSCLNPASNENSWLKICENPTKIGRSEEFINKKEAITLLLKQLGTKLQIAPKNYFTDVDNADWAKDYLYTALQLGLIKMDKSNKILPNEYLTKDAFASLIKKTTDLKPCSNVKQLIDAYIEKKNNLSNMDKIFSGN